MKQHRLKSYIEIFPHIVSCAKRSDIRFNNREYQVGDVITFCEGQHENGEFVYTGKEVSCIISHIDAYGCQDGYVNLSLKNVGLLIAT